MRWKSYSGASRYCFFLFWNYTNGDHVGQGMPEGHWSLSALPEKRTLGLDEVGRKTPISAWLSAKSQQCRVGLDQSPNNDLSPESLKCNHFHHGLLLFTSQLELPLCAPIWRLKAPSFHFTLFSLQILKTVGPEWGWTLSFSHSLPECRGRRRQSLSFSAGFSLLFTAIEVRLKALPACPSVCCLSLFGFRLSLSSLFLWPLSKCVTHLKVGQQVHSHTHTPAPKVLHNGAALVVFRTPATNYKCSSESQHICDIIFSEMYVFINGCLYVHIHIF